MRMPGFESLGAVPSKPVHPRGNRKCEACETCFCRRAAPRRVTYGPIDLAAQLDS